MPLGLGKHKWLRLLAGAIALYLLLIPVWLVLLKGLVIVAAAVADFIYGLFDSTVTITSAGRAINVSAGVNAQSRLANDFYSSGLSMDKVTYGLPLVAALVLVTRADSILAKARALTLGLSVMCLMSVFAVLMWAKMTSLQLEEQIANLTSSGAGNRSGFFYYAFHGYAFSQPVIAVAIWLALVMLGMFTDKKKQAQAAIVSRNAACPCGSNRKYKKCCGLV